MKISERGCEPSRWRPWHHRQMICERRRPIGPVRRLPRRRVGARRVGAAGPPPLGGRDAPPGRGPNVAPLSTTTRRPTGACVGAASSVNGEARPPTRRSGLAPARHGRDRPTHRAAGGAAGRDRRIIRLGMIPGAPSAACWNATSIMGYVPSAESPSKRVLDGAWMLSPGFPKRK